MIEQPTILETLLLMQRWHEGQIDKSGAPYWHHPYRVYKRLNNVVVENLLSERRIWKGDVFRGALLHDVEEDCGVTDEILASHGFTEVTRRIVSICSRFKDGRDAGKSYNQWIEWIAEQNDFGAVCVKFSDGADNTAPKRVVTLPETERGVVARAMWTQGFLLGRFPDLVPSAIRGDMPMPWETNDGD